MRKSLGEKRKEISPEEIEAITRLYGEFTEGEQVKIFPNEAFGYLRITVERPLRLRWDVTEETVALLSETKSWIELPEDEQADIAGRLRDLIGTSSTDRLVVAGKLGAVPKAIEKVVWDALTVRDPEAPLITKRHSEPDP